MSETTKTENNKKGNSRTKQAVFVCSLCSKTFVNKGNVHRHYKEVHDQEEKIELCGNIRCLICESLLRTYTDLDEHLTNQHNIAIETEYKSFTSFNEFQNWKSGIEKETQASFVMVNKKRTPALTIIKYVCHRSGTYKPKLIKDQRQRNMKIKGSNKINGHCSARITLTMKKNKVKVQFVSTHVGHDTDVGRLRFNKSDQEDIAKKLLQGIHKHQIIQDISKKFDPATRISYITNHDIHNIKVRYNVKPNITLQSDDAKSVDILVENLKISGDNPVLFYKPFGVEDNEVADDDFCLIYMNTAQQEMLKMYGNDIVMIDSTHGTNAYKIVLTTLMVIDGDYEGFPVAFLWSIRQSEAMFRNFFSIIKEKVPDIKPSVFMSDDTNAFYKAFCRVYKHLPKKILCDSNVEKNLNQNLNKILDLNKRKEIAKEIRAVVHELDVNAFETMLCAFLNTALADPVTQNYGEYIQKNFSGRPEQWAHCHRTEIHRNTNMCLEKWHQELQKHNLSITRNDQHKLDVSINSIIECLEIEFMNRLVSKSHSKTDYKIDEVTTNCNQLVPVEDLANEVEVEYIVISNDLQQTTVDNYTLEYAQSTAIKALNELKTSIMNCENCDLIENATTTMLTIISNLRDTNSQKHFSLPKTSQCKIAPNKKTGKQKRLLNSHQELLPALKKINKNVIFCANSTDET